MGKAKGCPGQGRAVTEGQPARSKMQNEHADLTDRKFTMLSILHPKPAITLTALRKKLDLAMWLLVVAGFCELFKVIILLKASTGP